MNRSWPFAWWDLDLFGPLLLVKETKYVIIAIDYYTKWMKFDPLNKIIDNQVIDFIQKNIIHRFGLPHTLVLNNGTQFTSKKLK